MFQILVMLPWMQPWEKTDLDGTTSRVVKNQRMEVEDQRGFYHRAALWYPSQDDETEPSSPIEDVEEEPVPTPTIQSLDPHNGKVLGSLPQAAKCGSHTTTKGKCLAGPSQTIDAEPGSIRATS